MKEVKLALCMYYDLNPQNMTVKGYYCLHYVSLEIRVQCLLETCLNKPEVGQEVGFKLKFFFLNNNV